MFHFTRFVPSLEYITEKYDLSIKQKTVKLWPLVGEKIGQKCLKDKGAQLSVLKEQYFILHI